MTASEERELLDAVRRIEAKCNALAKALGGPIVRREFAKIERRFPSSRRTFKEEN